MRRLGRQVPREILEDKALAAAMSMLPKNYNFEARARPRAPGRERRRRRRVLLGRGVAEQHRASRALPARPPLQVHKCVWRLRNAKCKLLALQFPEGLLLYACTLADIFKA